MRLDILLLISARPVVKLLMLTLDSITTTIIATYTSTSTVDVTEAMLSSTVVRYVARFSIATQDSTTAATLQTPSTLQMITV